MELLYDLMFVVMFGIVANELAHYRRKSTSHGDRWLYFAVLAVGRSWMNYSSFASAYDNDDWVFGVASRCSWSA